MNKRVSLRKFAHRVGVFRYSTVHFLVALILLIIVTPFLENSDNEKLIEVGLVTAVLVSAELAVSGQHKVLGLMLLVPALSSKWAHHLWPHIVPPAAHLFLGMVFSAYVVVSILRYILRTPRVNSEVLCAGVSIYLMIGLLWTFAYMMVAQLSPQAFSFVNDPVKGSVMTSFNAMYFSFTTLTTLGFGDITPVSKVARTLAFMEAITGMFYVAILISRLVAMYAPEKMEAAVSDTES